jgi:catechol 2,3-dioxygenase-like lactoylglutathione lyase family enzyme
LTIDCPDAEVQERLRHFYAEALGGEVVSGSVRARGWLLIFEVIADYKPPTWPLGETPKQMHFEWMVEDLESAVGRLQSLGATLAEYQRPEDVGFRVMLDPAGHPFCVATTTGVTRCSRTRGAGSTADRHASGVGWRCSCRWAFGFRAGF